MGKKTNREHKDRLFCFIFGRAENRAWTLSLYNAMNRTAYTEPDEIEITTMEDVIYMGMKNDVSFLVGDEISLYEHQSSYNPSSSKRYRRTENRWIWNRQSTRRSKRCRRVMRSRNSSQGTEAR